MVREAETTGQVSVLSPKAADTSATVQTVTVNLSRTSMSGGLPSSKPASAVAAPPPVSEIKAIEITAKDFDPIHPEKRPAGWSDIKLKKIYIKEWQDRKDGIDEDEIMRRRVHREKEVNDGYMCSYFNIFKYVSIYRYMYILIFVLKI